MPTLTQSHPKYRKHRASGNAVVTLNGTDHYLGPHGTKASHREYDRLITSWLLNGRQLPKPDNDLTIVELLTQFRKFAVGYYRKNGRPTRQLGNFDDAIRPLKKLYGREPVCEFGPLKLQTLQTVFAKTLCRRTVNARIGCLKLIFRWAVSREIAPPSLSHALDSVRGLGRQPHLAWRSGTGDLDVGDPQLRSTRHRPIQLPDRCPLPTQTATHSRVRR
jgi:hypothetical protein